MEFNRTEFKNRKSDNANRRKIKIISQSPSEIVADIERADSNVVEAGTPLTAETLNYWDGKIAEAIVAVAEAESAALAAQGKAEAAETAASNAVGEAEKSKTAAENSQNAAQQSANNIQSFDKRITTFENNLTTRVNELDNFITNEKGSKITVEGKLKGEVAFRLDPQGQIDSLSKNLGTKVKINNEVQTEVDILNVFYPVGTIYQTSNISFNPGTSFGGTWQKIENRFLLGSGMTFGNPGVQGGNKDAIIVSHTHTQNAHSHNISGSTISSGDHSHSASVYAASTLQGALYGNRITGAISSGTRMPYSNSASTDTEGSHTHNMNLSASSFAPTINSSGVSATNANMPPYEIVSIWKRIG